MKDISSNKFFRKLIIILIILVIWEIVSVVFTTGIHFPSFSDTFKRLMELVKTGEYWASVINSLARVILGYFAAVTTGLILGIACSYNKFLNEFFSFVMSIIRATPVVSFILIILISMRVNYIPVFIGFLMIVPIIYENISEGIANLDKKLIEVTKVYNISGAKYLFKILIPSVRPYISAALLSSFGLGWKAAISAEVLARPNSGIGSMLYDSKIYLEYTDLFAYTLTIIILSYMFEMIIKYFSAKLTIIEKGEDVYEY